MIMREISDEKRGRWVEQNKRWDENERQMG